MINIVIVIFALIEMKQFFVVNLVTELLIVIIFNVFFLPIVLKLIAYLTRNFMMLMVLTFKERGKVK